MVLGIRAALPMGIRAALDGVSVRAQAFFVEGFRPPVT